MMHTQPSIHQNKKLWTAVALQQELLKNSSLNLPGVSSNRRRAQRSSTINTNGPPQQRHDRSETSSDSRGSSKMVKLSLAQQLGLVDPPEPPLSQEQWSAIEQLAIERHHMIEPCPICMEPLGVQEKQMILDCSHIFHVDCFRNFEKFVKMNPDGKLQCPMCRKEEYKKRITSQGRKAYLNECATRYVEPVS